MAEIASEIAETVLEKLASEAYGEIRLAKSVRDDLKKLEEILKPELKDAEKKQNEGLRIWLVKLKDLLNDAVDVLDEIDCDVLDEFEFEVLRRQVVKDYGTAERKLYYASQKIQTQNRRRLAEYSSRSKPRNSVKKSVYHRGRQ